MLRIEVDQAIASREQTDLAKLLRTLPDLLTRATTYAHATASPQGWALLSDVYSIVYWLTARHRWMDLVEVAPIHQAWAADQLPNPLVNAVTERDRAGAFLNCGDFEGGLTVVDRALVAAEEFPATNTCITRSSVRPTPPPTCWTLKVISAILGRWSASLRS
jgi:hypothetical protein